MALLAGAVKRRNSSEGALPANSNAEGQSKRAKGADCDPAIGSPDAATKPAIDAGKPALAPVTPTGNSLSLLAYGSESESDAE